MIDELKDVNIQEAFNQLSNMANEFGDWLLKAYDSIVFDEPDKAEALMVLVMQARTIANAGDQGVFLAKMLDKVIKGE